MAKTLNNWLDEFVNNGADPKNVTDWPNNGGGGLTPVDKLPEKGNVNSLYKLSNGEIYSWLHKETQKEVVVYEEMEVGKSYKFKDEVLLSDAAKFFEKMSHGEYKILVRESERIEENIWFHIIWYPQNRTPEVSVVCGLLDAEDPATIDYNFGEALLGATYIEPTLTRYKEIPSMEVTETFVNQLLEVAGRTLEDISFLFELKEDHREIVTTVKEGWMKVSGPTFLDDSKIQNSIIYLGDENYDALNLYNTIDEGLDIRYVWRNVDARGIEEVSYDYLNSYQYGEEVNPETGENIKGVTLSFGDKNDINIVLYDPYMEPTISGKELNDFVAPFNEGEGSTIYWSDLFNNYIYPSLTQEDFNKELKNNSMIVSLFDDAIQLRIYYSGPDVETPYSTLTPVINATSGETHEFDRIGSCYNECTTLDLIDTKMTIENDTFADYKLHFDDSKDYSTSIIINFADGTSKAIKARKGFIENIIHETMVA